MEAERKPETVSGQVEFKNLTCLENAPADDELVKQIKEDLTEKSSVLEMMSGYMTALRGELDNDALPYRKLHRLFELGTVPKQMEGHHYGVTVGLRTGNLSGVTAEYGNLVGYIWGTVIAGIAPWVGKSFALMDEADREATLGTAVPKEVRVYRGINHFNVIKHAPVNVSSIALLTFMWHLKKAPDEERSRYGHEKNGGHFASYRAASIYDKTPREVFRLNYRFPELKNYPPLTHLIDEVVEIAGGLYLGQVLFATRRLLEKYNPAADDSIYRYQHFGYFLLFSEPWNGEARRLFANLQMPDAAVPAGTAPQKPAIFAAPDIDSRKFTELTLAETGDGDVDPDILREVKDDLSRHETVIDLLRSYSKGLGEDPHTDAPEFAKLHTLFNAGIGPETMEGFYRGARVTFQSQGLMAAFDVNTLNIVWQAARFLSPWTGKRFDPITPEMLSELTGGYEKMDVPTSFGSNTVVFRTFGERLTRQLMELAGAWIEDAPEEDRRQYGYDALTFFFIGKQTASIVPENKGKTVYQFNYRWKGLRTLPPDNFCIDEIVQIADGLYLGKLIYATELLRPWDPATSPSEYGYRLFGYFLLMDEEWHGRRLRIEFDLDNV